MRLSKERDSYKIATNEHCIRGKNTTVKGTNHVELLDHYDYDPDCFNYGPRNRDLAGQTPPLIRSLSDVRDLPGSVLPGAFSERNCFMLMPMVDPTWGVVCMLLAFIVGLIGGVRLTINGHSSSSSSSRMGR